MRLRSVALRGLTRFTSARPVSIDLAELGALVALVGQNGAGKTTALEAVAAALYKELPSRPGSLYEHAHGRDAFVEAVFDDHGAEVKVRVQVDAEARKTEGYVFVDGVSVTTGRAAEFEAEIAKRFGSAELFLASAFSAQNRAGNFLLMPKGDRKALFVELLGLGHLEALHERAKEQRATAEARLTVAREALETAQAEAAGLPEAEAELGAAWCVQEEASGALEAARVNEVAATSVLEQAKAAGPRLAALEQAAGAARREVAAAEAALSQAEALPDQARRTAERALRALDAQDLRGQETAARQRHEGGAFSRRNRRGAAEHTLKAAPEVEAAVAELPAVSAEREALDGAEALAEHLKRDLDGMEQQLGAAHRRVADAEKGAQRERERLERQAGLLGEVPCTAAKEWIPAAADQDNPDLDDTDLASLCPLLADARKARTAAAAVAVDPEIGREVEALEVAVAQARSAAMEATLTCDSIRLLGLRERVSQLQALANRAPMIEEARRQLEALVEEDAEAEADLEAELARLGDARAEADRLDASIRADLARALQEAYERIGAATKEAEGARHRAAQAEDDLSAARAAGGPSVAQAGADLRAAQATRVQAEDALRRADQRAAALEARVNALREKEAGLADLRADVAGVEEAVGDWGLLQKALGRDGVQALEIDAAGPEVARLCNDLLEACYGPRFSISFETLREKRSARGEYAEAFDVRVYDGGLERSVEALSGGERVVVGEAIGLALAIFNSRKSGIRWETLFRDETAGALDQENAQAYVDMLRRALELGGFAQVLFVSHQPEVWERADSRLVVAGGRVQLEGARAGEPEAVPA